MAGSAQDFILRALMSQQGPKIGGSRPSGGTGGYPEYGGDRGRYEDGSPMRAPSPGLGMGTPALQTYEDNSMGYPGTASANPNVHPNGVGDPILILLQTLLNQRHPNGM